MTYKYMCNMVFEIDILFFHLYEKVTNYSLCFLAREGTSNVEQVKERLLNYHINLHIRVLRDVAVELGRGFL